MVAERAASLLQTQSHTLFLSNAVPTRSLIAGYWTSGLRPTSMRGQGEAGGVNLRDSQQTWAREERQKGEEKGRGMIRMLLNKANNKGRRG